MPTRFLFLALHVVVISASSSLVPGGHCRDYNGKLYETGMHYMPGPDSCRLCICDSGLPKACKMVLCEAFTKCKSFQTVGSGNNCCEVICLDDQFNDGSTDFVNRLRQRKIRARESRQNTEDQRSIVGSIGYIAGNMGYMEGNLTSMDYSYGGTATHYPLWKPPSGYFPRGEAPPPYEEAVAISQAEALSAQCAAAAAAAAAAVTSPRPMSAVELQSSADINRRAQTAATMQQLQHLQPHQTTLMPQQTAQHSVAQPHQAPAHNVMPIHHVLGAPPAHQQTQSHQITQSTTNLINININSGGNITTIATGENHQPPYSLQNEQSTNNMVQEQQQQTSTTQQNPQQAINTSSVNSNNNSSRLHLAQSNSICVQTMTTQPNVQQQSQQSSIGQTVNSSNVSSSIGISASGKQTAATECGYKNCHLNTNVTTTTTGTNARRTQRLPEPLQQYVVDVEVNVGNASASGYHSLSSCSANPANEGEFELIASPTQFGNDSQLTNALSTPAIDTLIPTNNALDVATNNAVADATSQLQNTGHHTLPTQNTPIAKSIASSSANAATTSKAFSSSRRYHRTMPRYYTAADPLTSRDNQNTAANNTINTNKSSKQIESKQASINNANSAATTGSSNHNSSKKPTCQCPIQHVPMSYMGSTHLNSQNVTNNAFFTVLSNKLNTGTVNRISNTNNNASSLPYVSQRLNKTLQNHLNNTTESNVVSNTNSNSKRGALQSHCNYESKIATISTGELVNTASNNIAVAHHHHSHHSHHHGHHSSASLLPPPQHHDDSSSLVLGRVAKRSSSNSSDRFRSASSGSTRNPTNEAASISAAYLNSKVDAYLNLSHATSSNHHAATRVNDLMNPALPPKLHKSLTNLKSSTLAPSTPHHAGGGTVKNINKSNDLFKPSSGQLLLSSNTNSSINTQTTLTSTSSTSSSSPSSNLGSPQTSSNSSTTSVQTIYTLSKPSTSSAITTLNAVPAAHARNRDHDHLNLKTQPPILTLPSSSSATMSSTISASTFTGGTKINSSTFYPLQNNVTYTLPKNIAGKMSLNSTINSVVSKVPSVISLPAAASSKNNQENTAITVAESNSNESNSTVILASVKSTTLPKVLRSKKDFLQPNNAINNSNNVLNNCAAIVSSTACAVSQCNMPAYPKLFNTFNNPNPLISASTPSSLSSSSQAATNTTTNVAITTRQQCINMQTQTITSTLAGNLYVDDFFTCIPVTSSSVTSTSSGNCKQATLPACTTSKNYLNGKEHFVPNDTSLDDDYLSECENCKIAQSSKYYLDTAALSSTPQETMTLQRKSLEENKEEAETGYYRISHTLPSNSKKNTPLKSINNREPWFSTIPAASSSSDEDINE
uniref:VWFC domain-containing protein n=1 Tax=Glossina pallidipes TaxID=7398 RepID=A0A1A9Z8H9_GLOPL